MIRHEPEKVRTPIPPRAPVTPTYRPAFVPPKPAAPAPRPAPVKVDLSAVREGAIVVHRAFGEGRIEEIRRDGQGTCVMVRFARATKEFRIPGAFEQGFLRMKE